MRMPAFVAVSMGIAIAQAPQSPQSPKTPPVRIVGPATNLHIEALRSIMRGATAEFGGAWPSRAPQAFEYNGETYHYLPCDAGASANAVAPRRDLSPSHRIVAPELLRLRRVSPHSAPGGPGS